MKKIKEKKNLLFIIFLFFVSRLLFIIFIFKDTSSILKLFDEVHYLKIAQYGYFNEPRLYAFFPLYPLMIRLFNTIGIPYKIAGILISNISTVFSLILIHKLCDENKINTMIVFLISPILAFTTLIYTESFYLFLTLFAFYFYKKDKFIMAAIFTGLSMLTRNSGIILWGAIGLDMLFRFFQKKDILFRNIIIFGFLSLMIGSLYPIFLYVNTGDFFKFASVQNEYWDRDTGFFLLTFIKDLEFLYHKFNFAQIYLFLQNWGFFIVGVLLSIKIRKKDFVSAIYLLVSLFAFTLSYNVDTNIPTNGLFRYILTLYPIYFYFNELKTNNKVFNRVLILIYFILTFCNTFFIYSGYFIA